MQGDAAGFGLEELFADGREGDGCVREFPLRVRGRFDFRAKGAAKDLMAEADAAEADVWSFDP